MIKKFPYLAITIITVQKETTMSAKCFILNSELDFKLRVEAFNRRVTEVSIVRIALNEYFDRLEKERNEKIIPEETEFAPIGERF